MRRIVVTTLVAVAAFAFPTFVGEADAAAPSLIPPVDGPIAVRFDAPEHAYGPGHRGIDYAVPAGTPVRASAPGLVTFAGPVADAVAVTILHEGGLETTYSSLATVAARAGARVDEGTWIGTAGRAHPGGLEGLHFGVKVNGVYADPLAFVGTVSVAGAIHLAPLVWQPSEVLPAPFPRIDSAGTAARPCGDRVPLAGLPPSPNDNVAVAIAGIGSKTKDGTDATIYEHGPEALGYAPEKVYRFSYAGSAGPRGHEPYARTDTQGDIRSAATRLGELLMRIARSHPGTAVDLIAHSQGGIVARTFLSLRHRAYDPRLPRVGHLVTFATPHGGAPLAESIPALDATSWGRLALDGLALWSSRGGPVPDPRSAAVAQLTPGSGLLRVLAREDVVFGTRVLALAIPNDALVPADRALWPGEPGAIVAPAGWSGHEAIVSSSEALGIAHAFLRDAPAPCAGPWDGLGRGLGRAMSWLLSKAGTGGALLEELVRH